MNPSTIERIIYLSFRNYLSHEEIAWILQIDYEQVCVVVLIEQYTHELLSENEFTSFAARRFFKDILDWEPNDWRTDAPPLSPILGKAV